MRLIPTMEEKYSLREIHKKEIWEDFVLKQNPATFLQSWNWGEVNKEIGKSVKRYQIFDNKKIIGCFQLIFESAKRGPHLIIPGGPIIDWKNQKLVKYVKDSLLKICSENKLWFSRIRPDVFDSDENRKLFKYYGFIKSPMHLHAENTWILNIDVDEEDLLKNMRKTTRYLIRKADGYQLKFIVSKNKDDASILFDLQRESVKRHHFVGFSKKIFSSEIDLFGQDGQAKLFICRKNRENLAAAVIIFYKNTAYYYHSGSSNHSREIPAMYFLQWNIIKYAKSIGMKYYNFWGISPNLNPKHRFYGVTLFKTGFGGERVDWIGAQDLPVSSLYYFTYLFESIRKILRRL